MLLVLLLHCTVLVPRTPLEEGFLSVMRLGRTGVDLFFVLSGFLITGILFDSKKQSRYFRNFYARRVLRIFPLYYALVIFSLLILPHFAHPKLANFSRIQGDELYYWLLLSNFSTAMRHEVRHGILDVTWSLSIEEQFYLLWPLVVAFLDRQRLLKLCAVIVATALVVRWGLAARGAHWLTIYTLTPCRMDGLAVGAFIALYLRAPEAEAALARLLKLARPLLIFSTVALLPIGYFESLREEDAGRLGQTVFYTLIVLFYGALLVMAIAAPAGSRLGRVLGSRFLVFLGTYSYGIYLVHLPLRAVIRDLVFRPAQFFTVLGSQLPAQLVFYGMAGTLAVAVAYASYHLFEKHFLKLKRYFPEG